MERHLKRSSAFRLTELRPPGQVLPARRHGRAGKYASAQRQAQSQAQSQAQIQAQKKQPGKRKHIVVNEK